MDNFNIYSFKTQMLQKHGLIVTLQPSSSTGDSD